LGCLFEDGRDPVGAGSGAEHDQADEHRQSAGGGDHEGLQGRASRGKTGPGVADQQIGQDRGEFPEDEQQKQVVRRDQAEHRAGEREKLGAEAAQIVVLVLEIAGAVHQDKGTHAQHQQGHDPCQCVEAEGELNAEVRDPGSDFACLAATFAAGRPSCRIDRAVLEQQPNEGPGRHCSKRVERAPSEFPEDERRHSSNRKVHGKDCDHCILRKFWNSIIKSWSRRLNRLGSVRTVYQEGTDTFPSGPVAGVGFPETPRDFSLPVRRGRIASAL
jgi:hypothetical protein